MASITRTFLVTGANRGIGLAISEELGKRGHKIIGTVRNPKSADSLRNIPNVIGIEQLDVSNETSVVNLKNRLLESGIKITGIINNAGIFAKKNEEGESIQQSLFDLKPEIFMSHFQINTMGPFLVNRELVKLLDKSEQFPVVITIGSVMGSIKELKDHRSAHYRVSKCGGHMITKLFSLEITDICFVNIHPGWVKTDMGSMKAPVTQENSAKGIINVIESLKLDDSGKFFDYKGNIHEY